MIYLIAFLVMVGIAGVFTIAFAATQLSLGNLGSWWPRHPVLAAVAFAFFAYLALVFAGIAVGTWIDHMVISGDAGPR